jgi:hypothetical protein
LRNYPETRKGAKVRKAIYITAIGLAALGLLAAGCGGDDGSDGGNGDGGEAAAGQTEAGGEGSAQSGAEGSSLSKKEYIARANAICKKAKKTVPSGNGLKIEDVEEAAFTALRRERESLEALAAPPKDEEQVEAIFAAHREAVEALEDPDDAAEDAPRYTEVAKLYRGYGITGCP